MISARVLANAVITLLLVVFGIAVLYAYGQKQPPSQTVDYSQAVAEIQQGKVKVVETTIGGNTAQLELKDGTKQQTTVPSPDNFDKLITDYNAAHPDQPIAYRPVQDGQPAQWLGQLLIAILPIVFIAGLFLYMMRQARGQDRLPRSLVTVATPQAPQAIGPYAQAIVSGDLIFCSGMVALDPRSGELVTSGIADETRRVLENLAAVLHAAGSDLRHVVKTTVFLTNIADFKEMNDVYADVFGGHRPARATVEVSRLPRGARVEIECVAIRAR
jgi:2-iminobutanoate/2-iminopropanoate deaminase